MNILGISCFYHDSAACCCATASSSPPPTRSASRARGTTPTSRSGPRYCLAKAGITIDDLDYVVFYDKPLVKFERILSTYLATFPQLAALVHRRRCRSG